MKNTMIITKKESKNLQLNEITKEELINLVKDELANYYLNQLDNLDSYSYLKEEEIIYVLKIFAYEKCNKLIDKMIRDKFPNDKIDELFNGQVYNAKVDIQNDLEGNVEINLDLNLAG